MNHQYRNTHTGEVVTLTDLEWRGQYREPLMIMSNGTKWDLREFRRYHEHIKDEMPLPDAMRVVDVYDDWIIGELSRECPIHCGGKVYWGDAGQFVGIPKDRVGKPIFHDDPEMLTLLIDWGAE